jgi:hypothetical protein
MATGVGKAAKRRYYIILSQKFNKKRPQEEARQPREDIASYLQWNSIRNNHMRKQGSQDRLLHYI